MCWRNYENSRKADEKKTFSWNCFCFHSIQHSSFVSVSYRRFNLNSILPAIVDSGEGVVVPLMCQIKCGLDFRFCKKRNKTISWCVSFR